jgi:hypothetical protein
VPIYRKYLKNTKLQICQNITTSGGGQFCRYVKDTATFGNKNLSTINGRGQKNDLQ